MIQSIEFRNFKALRDATLPLGPCTLIVGPNGSGKSTALQGLQAVQNPDQIVYDRVVTAGSAPDATPVVVQLNWGGADEGVHSIRHWDSDGGTNNRLEFSQGVERGHVTRLDAISKQIRVFAFDAAKLASVVKLTKETELQSDGSGLVVVLDQLRDNEPERFDGLNRELGIWLPEFDRILFDVPKDGMRAFSLRTRNGQLKIPAENLSDGTLLSLALLTLAYLPDPPPLIGLEEPDHGIHPRLLRRVQDAIYRLAYPADHGEDRGPVQVIATTHSPYFLDLFKDRPEEVVIAEKTDDGVQFRRLSDDPHVQEILGDAPLGEIWYTGVLGGVPMER